MYLILEIQKSEGIITTFVTTYDNRNKAESKYYEILSEATESSYDGHGATLLTEKGQAIRSEYYDHKVENIENEGENI